MISVLLSFAIVLATWGAEGGPWVLPGCSPDQCLNGGVCNGTMCDCTGTGYTGPFCETQDVVIVDCPTEAVAGLSWRSPLLPQITNQVTKSCDEVFDSLTAGSITRSCTNGTWSPLDYSQCLINADSAFALLWIPLAVNSSMLQSAVPALKIELYQRLALNDSFTLKFVRVVEIGSRSSSSYNSALFVLYLPTLQPYPEIESLLLNFTSMTGTGVHTIDWPPVAMDAPLGIQGFYWAASCPCYQPADTLFLGLCEEVVPISACMDDDHGTFKCNPPYFIGDGDDCTVDEDGDGFPNVPLEICAQLNNTNASYCTQDNCPVHFNPAQDRTECVAPPEFNGCRMEEDEVWEISWGNTPHGQTDKQRCPLGPGFATRYCGQDGWEPAMVGQCGSYQFSQLQDDISESFNSDNFEGRLESSANIFQQMRTLTRPGTRQRSLLPSDLNITNRLVDTVLELLEEIQERDISVDIPQLDIADILSDVLTSTDIDGWISLQEMSAGSRQLLDISERYGLYLSKDVSDGDNKRRFLHTDNVVIVYKNAIPDVDGDQMFPETLEDLNGTFTSIPAQIMIPQGFLREQMEENRTSVPVSTILYRNLEQTLPVDVNSTQVASMVISGQVSQRNVFNSTSLQVEPIAIKFLFNATENATKYFCAYWQFSDPVGSGSWRTDGVSMMSQQISSDGQTVTVYCNATHLTSFAVLVDLSGTLNPGDNNTGVDETELLALQIVSYIGCVISLVCLLATIIFFLLMGSELFHKVHYFIHLNLSIVLFLAYLMFVVGIETARANEGACVFVAVWLHYFFLSSFSWMLCEGIMLYLMLVVVFSKLSKRWWFFTIIGYGIPVIPVIVTLGARVSDYGVEDSNGSLSYCWLSIENGVIWGFVGPMLAIIMVNLVFLVIALEKVFRSTYKLVKRKRSVKGEKSDSENIDTRERRALFIKLFVATIVLLPLLGVTWILGIFVVNDNTLVFAWLFTIINSLQGLSIFFFHVLRSDKVWKSRRARQMRSTISRRLTSSTIKASTIRCFSLEKGKATLSSVSVTTGPLSSEKYAMASSLEKGTTDFESAPQGPNILEQSVQCANDQVKKKMAKNGRIENDDSCE